MARFHLPSENWQAAALTGDEARHLSQVLRGKAGDSITVFDGHGRRASAKVLEVSRDRVSLEISEVVSPAPPQPRITLAQANALLVHPEFSGPCRAGDTVAFLPLP